MIRKNATIIAVIQSIGTIQPPPVSILNILFRRPVLVVGIPVAFAILRFADVMPNARFQLKDNPGIPLLLRLPMNNSCLLKKTQKTKP